ncbi:MAG: hypothetical protein F9K22_03800 [Bacteroidetes bacterium]|nr:MAG: hypothetical protein F9K22_03800 [Bacteroidota bacterium]
MVPLTANTLAIVKRLFPSSGERAEVIRLLQNDCSDNVWDRATPAEMERLWFSALKVSNGAMEGLVHAVAEAQTDYRDLLMAAGFGLDVEAHRRWGEMMLRERSGI